MKILFVDFDGVLNSNATTLQPGDELWSASQLEPTLVARLDALVTRSGACVVVSSSWRLIHASAEQLEALLRARGFAGRVHGLTPALYRGPEGAPVVRGHEIERWLREHPEVTRYVILDDDATFLDEQQPWLVRTDSATGLTESDAERALTLLASS